MPEPTPSIADKDVRHIATLARLDLPDDRLALFSTQLGSILGYVQRIMSVNVDGVEPMAHPMPVQNVFREDVAGPALPLEAVLQNAPETDGPFFKVPKVVGGDDSAG